MSLWVPWLLLATLCRCTGGSKTWDTPNGVIRTTGVVAQLYKCGFYHLHDCLAISVAHNHSCHGAACCVPRNATGAPVLPRRPIDLRLAQARLRGGHVWLRCYCAQRISPATAGIKVRRTPPRGKHRVGIQSQALTVYSCFAATRSIFTISSAPRHTPRRIFLPMVSTRCAR